MSFASVGGTKLFYVTSGRGIPFISLHGGLGFDHAYMRAPLAPQEELMRVTYFDQRCNGRSECPGVETISMEQLAEDVDGLRTELGYERVGLVGHSYGAFVALEYATARPERVSHLVLMGASPGRFDPTTEELAERGDRSWVTPEIQRALHDLLARLPSTNEEFASMLPRLAPAYLRSGDASLLTAELSRAILNAAALRRGFEVLSGWSVVDRLARITCPTLVMCGRHDLFTTPECAKRLATEIPKAELAWFEESGHFPWLEEPRAFAERLRDYLVEHW